MPGDLASPPLEPFRAGHGATVALLAAVAGSVDAAGFVCLAGLLPSHLTASLVMLTASLGERDSADVSARLAMIPVFVLGVASSRWLARACARRGLAPLPYLLGILTLGLSAFFVVGALFDGLLSDHPRALVFVGGLGVASMAVQNAIMRLSLPTVGPTTVMTGNLTQVVMASADLLMRRTRGGEVADVRARLAHAGLPLAGFLLGSLGGGYVAARHGLTCLAIPVALSATATTYVWRKLPSLQSAGERTAARAPLLFPQPARG